ncbi:probable glutamate receptor [Macrobrachium nipponense]|uniref:probable glutamate receptor n=1 Tax=Macrobrachium nipponense TaxID=159736 RepID=UPI0030C88A2A
MVELASWTAKYGLLHSSDLSLFPDKFDRLIDAGHLIVAGDDFPPHMKVTEFPYGRDGPPHIFIGPLGNFVEILGNSINFSYTLVRPPDRAWGYLQPNGSWIGMVGMVFRKEVDFPPPRAPFVFFLTYTRARTDYALPLVGDNIRITAKRGATEVDPWGFALPLAPDVWGATFLSMAFVILLTMIFTLAETSRNLTKSSLMDIFRILLQQDMNISRPVESWDRVLLAAWIVTILVLSKSYSGNLMSLLAVRYVPQPYQSLRAVLDDSSITMLWEGGTAYVQVFMNAESGIYREVAESLGKGRISYVKSSEYTQAMEQVSRSSRHVLIIEDLGLQMLLAEDFTKRGHCLFYLSKELFLPSMFGLVVQKHSPLGPAIARRMSSVTESGLYTQWMKDAVPNSTACLQAPTKIVVMSALSLSNLWGMFTLLAGGYVFSAITLAVEYAVSRFTLSSF